MLPESITNPIEATFYRFESINKILGFDLYWYYRFYNNGLILIKAKSIYKDGVDRQFHYNEWTNEYQFENYSEASQFILEHPVFGKNRYEIIKVIEIETDKNI